MKCHEVITHHQFQGAVAESDPFVAHMSTLYPGNFHIINPYGQRISFSEPVSFELSVNRENGLHFMTFYHLLHEMWSFCPV